MTTGDPLLRVAALPGVPEAVDAVRAAVDRLLSHRVLRRRSAEVTAECTLRSARASAALDGADLPLDALRADLLAGGVVPGVGPAAGVVEGAVRLQAELGGLLGSWERAPRQALARMHVLAGRSMGPSGLGSGLGFGGGSGFGSAAGPDDGAEGLGRPRPAGVDAEDPLGLGPAPSPAEVAARVDALAALVVRPTTAPAIVSAAVVHGELLVLRPFPAGNGLVARAASRLVLVARGLDPKAVTAPDVGHVELGEQYAAAARGYQAGGPDGVAGWVRHCARAVELGAREGLAVCEALLRAE